jgi:L-ribulose-5-phosphate 3-epimerase UlaE
MVTAAKTKKEIKKPSCIQEYNFHMGRVHKKDKNYSHIFWKEKKHKEVHEVVQMVPECIQTQCSSSIQRKPISEKDRTFHFQNAIREILGQRKTVKS